MCKEWCVIMLLSKYQLTLVTNKAKNTVYMVVAISSLRQSTANIRDLPLQCNTLEKYLSLMSILLWQFQKAMRRKKKKQFDEQWENHTGDTIRWVTEITQPCVHMCDGLFICQLYLLPDLLEEMDCKEDTPLTLPFCTICFPLTVDNSDMN
jgi:hypothetical protein